MRSISVVKWGVLIVLPIIMWQCYWFVGFNQELAKLVNFIISFALLAIVGLRGITGNLARNGYNRFILWIVALFMVSLITSYIYWGQSPILTFRAGVALLSILYFYVLKWFKVSKRELFKLVSIFAGIYVVLWLYALTQAPKVVFGNLEEVNSSRGFYRILQLKSLDTLCVFFFISFTRIITNKSKLKWIILSVGSFIVIFLSLSRMLAFSILIASIGFLFRKRFVLAIIAVFLLFVGFNQLSQNAIVSELIDMTETQINNSEENNLRLVEYKNVFSAYPFHVGTALFGNGSPHIKSYYGRYDEALKNSIGFNLTDAGYVGVYIEYGIAMLIVLFLLLAKVVRASVPMDTQPFRLYIISLFILSITSYSFWANGISFSICIYALSLVGGSGFTNKDVKTHDKQGVVSF